MPSTSEGFSGGAPASRIRAANDKPINAHADYVLYWMIAARRSSSNFALDRAIAWAVELGLPFVVLEAFLDSIPAQNAWRLLAFRESAGLGPTDLD